MCSLSVFCFLFSVFSAPVDLRETFVSSDAKHLLIIDGGMEASSPAALDPKNKWSFPFEINGLVAENRKPNSENPELRFRVFCQSQKDIALARRVTRSLLRFWDLAHSKLGFDHSRLYGKLVNVYLCEGGTPGGEQAFFQRQNSIYIYQLSTFKPPIEMVREIAHEYGHAMLPPVGGFVTPEDWGNGYLGERLFLTWAQELHSDDLMGVESRELAEWLRKKAAPLARKVWQNGPPSKMKMDDYIGLNLYAWQAFPNVLGRAMLLAGGQDAAACVRGLVNAVNEKRSWRITVPSGLTEIWLPLRGKWNVSGGKIIQKRGDWLKVRCAGSRLAVGR